MSETTGVGLAAVSAATGITVAGVATGLTFEVLLPGFVGALASLSFLDHMTIPKRCWSLVTSTLLAGYTAPTLSTGLGKLIGTDPTSPIFAAVFIGLVAQVAIPGLLTVVKARIAKLEPKPKQE